MGGPTEIVDQLRYVPTIDLPVLEHLTGWSVDYGSWCHPTPAVAMVRWADPGRPAAGLVVWDGIPEPDSDQVGTPTGDGLWSTTYYFGTQLQITVNGQRDGGWFQVVGRGDLDEATVVDAATQFRATGNLQLDQQIWTDVTPSKASQAVPAVVWYLDARGTGDVFSADVRLRPDFSPEGVAAEAVFECELVEVPTKSRTVIGVRCEGASSLTWEISPGIVAGISGNNFANPNQIIEAAGSMTLLSETDPALPPPPADDQ